MVHDDTDDPGNVRSTLTLPMIQSVSGCIATLTYVSMQCAYTWAFEGFG